MHPSWSPDGLLIAVAGRKGVVVVEASSGTVLAHLNGHERFVYRAIFLPDGKRIVSCAADTTAVIWDLAAALLPEERMTATQAWSLLAADGSLAYRALSVLATQPATALELLERVVPAAKAPSTATSMAGLIEQLSDADRRVRERAHLELERAGQAARVEVAQALRRPPPGEAGERLRSIARLIGADAAAADALAGDMPEQLRERRALQLLCWVASDKPVEARDLLRRFVQSAHADVRAAAMLKVGQVENVAPATRP